MNEHPFGWLSFLPPLVAILLAIVTRRVILSLLLGLFVGSLILARGDVFVAVGSLFNEHLWGKLTDSATLHIFCFTLLMGVMVGIVNRGAGMRGLVDVITPIANNRRRGQLVTWVLGLFVFFDDYANTMLLGNTLRPLTDRLKISREKLAYLVDSTAAPVSGLALVSTWVAGEIGYITDGVQNIEGDANWNPFTLFMASIPYRFYVLWALVFVPMVGFLGRDFGPMLTAERDQTGRDDDDESEEAANPDPTAPDEDTPARWFNGVIPIVITVAAVVWFLFQSGLENCTADTIYQQLAWGTSDGFPVAAVAETARESFETFDVDGNQLISAAEFETWFEETDDFTFSLADVFGNADSYGALLWGALAGALAAMFLIWPQRIISSQDMLTAGIAGALHMAPALGILWLASCLSAMTGNSANDAETVRQEHAKWVISALAEHQLSSEDAAAYLRKQSLPPRTVALTALADSPSVEALQRRLQAAGYNAEESAKAASVFVDAGGDAIEPFYAYRAYRLYSGQFLTGQLERLKQASPFIAENFTKLLPTLVFVLASIVAFATGTSWGTMGIVMPLVIPLAYAQLAVGGSVTGADPIMLCCIGGVLAGAIFGDHCSPISDTTVLSSQASGCDHVAHVRTQMPYALLVAVIAILCGTLPVGYGVPVWPLLPVGVVAMWGALMILGRTVEE